MNSRRLLENADHTARPTKKRVAELVELTKVRLALRDLDHDGNISKVLSNLCLDIVRIERIDDCVRCCCGRGNVRRSSRSVSMSGMRQKNYRKQNSDQGSAVHPYSVARG